MKITYEISLNDFDFWGHAKAITSRLTTNEMAIIEDYLDAAYPEGINKTELNDIFAYYGNVIIAHWLGISEEKIMEREPF